MLQVHAWVSQEAMHCIIISYCKKHEIISHHLPNKCCIAISLGCVKYLAMVFPMFETCWWIQCVCEGGREEYSTFARDQIDDLKLWLIGWGNN